jgi:hypothetical protein
VELGLAQVVQLQAGHGVVREQAHGFPPCPSSLQRRA